MHWQVANWSLLRTLAAQQRARAMTGKSKSKRGSHLTNLNAAHPKDNTKRTHNWLVASDDDKDEDYDADALSSLSSDDEMEFGDDSMPVDVAEELHALASGGRKTAVKKQRLFRSAPSSIPRFTALQAAEMGADLVAVCSRVLQG